MTLLFFLQQNKVYTFLTQYKYEYDSCSNILLKGIKQYTLKTNNHKNKTVKMMTSVYAKGNTGTENINAAIQEVQ